MLFSIDVVNSSASTQYMIDHFNLSKIIVIGTCAGIDSCYKPLDIVIPNKLVQYDCTVKDRFMLLVMGRLSCLLIFHGMQHLVLF